ncbi:MAG: phage terminase large subunit family protein [Phycisphaerales bacterium]|nr:phage terminase large subunit family protein [Phycisphaerales bacterium]
MKHKTAEGASLRPDMVLIDDPQTEESAWSPSQCATRLRTINGAVLGLAGPGQRLAAFATVTVVRSGDMADELLSRDRNPQWRGQRTRMVVAWPSDERRWEQYAELYRQALRDDRSPREATEFYQSNRGAMDAGAVVAWPEKHYPDELSAIQHAMNLRIRQGRAAFAAEYQNDPIDDRDDSALARLSSQDLLRRGSGLPRGVVPHDAVCVTAFVDVMERALYWCAVAWKADFGGTVIDYGTEPEQESEYFTLRQVRRTLASQAPGAGPEGAIRAGLDRLVMRLASRRWRREGDANIATVLDRILVDAGDNTALVYDFCRASAAAVYPSHGRYIGPLARPMAEYEARPGERIGLDWRMPIGTRGLRHVNFDANRWKSFVNRRLLLAVGDAGAITLFGGGASGGAADHRMFADHLCNERAELLSGHGRTVEVWKPTRVGTDNHWWDCLVGCAVAASVHGLALPGIDSRRRVPRAKLSQQLARAMSRRAE